MEVVAYTHSCDRSPVAVRGEARRVVSCCLVLWLVRVEGAVGGEITGVRAEGDALMLMGVNVSRRRARRGAARPRGGARWTPNSRKKERKPTTQGRDGRTARRHHTGILRREV